MQGVSVENSKLDNGRLLGSLLVVSSRVPSFAEAVKLTEVIGHSLSDAVQITFSIKPLSIACVPPHGVVPPGHTYYPLEFFAGLFALRKLDPARLPQYLYPFKLAITTGLTASLVLQ